MTALKIRYSHKGWLYAPGTGSTAVSAVFDGVVARTQWVAGYGTTAVIDHGDHYYSVYAHISKMRAKTGEPLRKGEAFADADGPKGLYFELRHFSEAENPARWLTPQGVSTAQATESF